MRSPWPTLTLLTMSACARTCSTEPPAPPAPPPQPAALLDARLADIKTRALLYKTDRDAPCPDLPGARALQPVLGRYCAYAPAGDAPFAAPPSAPGQASAFDQLALTPMTTPDPAFADGLRHTWLGMTTWAAGWPTRACDVAGVTCAEGEARKPLPADRRRVRLELLDAVAEPAGYDALRPFDSSLVSADPAWSDPRVHGLDMFRMATTITCYNGPDDSGCPVELGLRQVLGQAREPGAPANADQWGTFYDLARGIQDAVDAWVLRPGTAEGQLVINLSLAWHPVFGGVPGDALQVVAEGANVTQADGSVAPFHWAEAEPDRFTLGVRAVYDALVYARCHDVLVIAAAGNATAGTHGQEGPLLPAAWEALPTTRLPSSREACAPHRHPDAGAHRLPDPGMPLVVAVGALGPNRAHETDRAQPEASELGAGRKGGMPALAAWGFQVGSKEPPDQLTGVIGVTGTSAAAVTVSSTAALVASVASPPGDAMELVRKLVRGPEGPAPTRPLELTDPRHSTTDLPVSEAFLASAASFGARRVAWIRPCEFLRPIGGACERDQPAELKLTADLGLPRPGAPVVAWSPVATGLNGYSPSIQPGLVKQPDWPLCPECLLDLQSGALHVAVVEPSNPPLEVYFRLRNSEYTVLGSQEIALSAFEEEEIEGVTWETYDATWSNIPESIKAQTSYATIELLIGQGSGSGGSAPPPPLVSILIVPIVNGNG